MKMNRKGSLLLILCITIFAWVSASYAADAGGSAKSQSKPQIIKLKVDIKHEKELQAFIDEGHQPWRQEAVDVAYVSLSGINDNSIKYEDCRSISASRTKARVECRGKKKYLVTLRRLVKTTPSGIWTAISIEVY